MTPTANALNEADRVLHSLAQLLALTGTNLLPKQPDDSQANLLWNADRQRLECRPFAQEAHSLRLVVDLPTLSLQFLDEKDGPVNVLAVAGVTPETVQTWWQTTLQDWSFSTDKPLSYTLNTASVLAEEPYVRPVGLTEWGNWRTIAHEQMAYLNAQSGLSSDIRIWPHHFDTGVYYSQPDDAGHERAAIWAGFAIADAICDEPYFYLSGYDTRQSLNFSAASPLSTGRWLARPDWQGAMLPVSEASTKEKISRFLSESYHWLWGQVSV